jgi:hypothetical protein
MMTVWLKYKLRTCIATVPVPGTYFCVSDGISSGVPTFHYRSVLRNFRHGYPIRIRIVRLELNNFLAFHTYSTLQLKIFKILKMKMFQRATLKLSKTSVKYSKAEFVR